MLRVSGGVSRMLGHFEKNASARMCAYLNVHVHTNMYVCPPGWPVDKSPLNNTGMVTPDYFSTLPHLQQQSTASRKWFKQKLAKAPRSNMLKEHFGNTFLYKNNVHHVNDSNAYKHVHEPGAYIFINIILQICAPKCWDEDQAPPKPMFELHDCVGRRGVL